MLGTKKVSEVISSVYMRQYRQLAYPCPPDVVSPVVDVHSHSHKRITFNYLTTFC